MLEALEVGDLGDEDDRRERVDAAQAAELGDGRLVGLLLGGGRELLVERLEAAECPIEAGEVLGEDRLRGGVVEGLFAQPLPVHHRLVLLSLGKAAPVAEEELQQPVAARE